MAKNRDVDGKYSAEVPSTTPRTYLESRLFTFVGTATLEVEE